MDAHPLGLVDAPPPIRAPYTATVDIPRAGAWTFRAWTLEEWHALPRRVRDEVEPHASILAGDLVVMFELGDIARPADPSPLRVVVWHGS